jgi:hypothetical protein
MTQMAFDNRMDGMDRLSCARELLWWDENRAAEVFTALAGDDEVQQAAHIFTGVLPNMADMDSSIQMLAEQVRGSSTAQRNRNDAIEQLLRLDPNQALGVMIELTEASDQEERQWAFQRLVKALDALEITSRIDRELR